MNLYNDFSTSVKKAFDEIDSEWERYNGIVICGTHAPKNWEAQVDVLQEARCNNVPTLGICFGMQLMAVEYARNVLGVTNAVSAEFTTEHDGRGKRVIKKLRELNVGLKNGESYWNNYEVDTDYFKKKPRVDVSKDIFLLKAHPHYVGVQYHPEYQSSKDKPHPILIHFLEVCKNGNAVWHQV